MRAAMYAAFGGEISIADVSDPSPPDDGVVISVGATGICRSDWHGWMGHDADIAVPHVPGHEFAGAVVAIGREVGRFSIGDRVTVPFAIGCGRCRQCRAGNQQICDDYYQPGFTGWGSFAELVAVPHADENLVALPGGMPFPTAAALGCRFITSFRAMRDQAAVTPGEWVAVHGCGGIGLSAVMIASALGARVVAIDVRRQALDLAVRVGAEVTIDASGGADVATAVAAASEGGAHVSLDALGSSATAADAIRGLRKQGRHIQVGLLPGPTPLPMDLVIARELVIKGSHGMQARRYPEMLAMIDEGTLRPDLLVGRTIGLDDVPGALEQMGRFPDTGMTVVDLGATG